MAHAGNAARRAGDGDSEVDVVQTLEDTPSQQEEKKKGTFSLRFFGWVFGYGFCHDEI